MKNIFREIILFILFATPLGYLLGLLKIIDLNENFAVSIQMDGNRPLNVNVKQYPLTSERLRWISHGTTLIIQALFTIAAAPHDPQIKNALLGLMGGYTWLTLLLGITVFASGLFPNFPWNKRPFGISIFEVIFFVSLFTTVGILISK